MADVADEYRSSLSELNFNSKPHINMLTMIAEENIKHATVIVQTIIGHLNSVPTDMMLPTMYLIDSIIKNIGKVYIQLFSKNLVNLFTSVFKKVDETVRSLLYKLRSTWTGIFPNALLLRLDRSVSSLDPAWPIIAHSSQNIHVNPKFLDKPAAEASKKKETVISPQSALIHEAAIEMKKKQLEVLKVLQEKKQQLIDLQIKAEEKKASENSGLKSQKAVNNRDPRLSKSVLGSDDSASLQSVVVIPNRSQAAVKKSDEKHSSSPDSKKIKIDTSVSAVKKDLRKKIDDVKNHSKVNVDQNHHDDPNSHSRDQQTIKVDVQKNKLRKRTLSADYSAVPSKRVVVDERPVTNSENVLQRVNLDVSNKSIKNCDTFNHVASNDVVSSKKSIDHYKQPVNVKLKEPPPYKTNHRLEPPPPAPLLFGNEDKDYRTLIPKEQDCDERILNEVTHPKRLPVPVVKSFVLDSKERKVYFVDNRSFAVMDDNIPKELTFEGPPKLIFVECLPKPFELGFGGHEVKFEVDGKWNTIKFGTPGREVYINKYPYDAQFGGPPFTVLLESGKIHRIQISGPPPQVILSKTPAFELYERFCQSNQEFLKRFNNHHGVNHDAISSEIPAAAARDVDMRVNNAEFSSMFPLEKVNDIDWQRMPIGDSVQAVWNAPKNAFETFKDGKPSLMPSRNFRGGPPDWNRPFSDANHNMNIPPPPLPPKQIINRLPGIPPSTTYERDFSDVNMNLRRFPASECTSSVPTSINMSLPPPNFNKPPDFASNPRFNNLHFSNTLRLTPPPLPPFMGPVPTSCCMTAPFVNTIVTAPMPMTTLTGPVQVTCLTAPIPATSISNSSQVSCSSSSSQMTALLPTPMSGAALLPTPMSGNALLPTPISVASLSNPMPPPSMLAVTSSPAVNMNIFYEKLVAAGIIGNTSGTSSSPLTISALTESENDMEEEMEEVIQEPIPEIILEPKGLKEYHRGVINLLHSGSQCATCGMRFKEIQSEQYSRHLDWHFRTNRREKRGAKTPFSRKLYYEVKDWIQFKEFEEVDERAPSYFELQASGEQLDEDTPENVFSVPSTECDSEICAVCSEQFQLFWVEEEEEWHLRNSVKYDEQVYHPACYEDFKKANDSANADLDTSVEESIIEAEMDEDEVKAEIKSETVTEGSETKMADLEAIKPDLEIVNPKPETVKSEPETVKAETETVKTEPESVMEGPEAAVEEPEAAVEEPEAAVEEPEAAVEEPEAAMEEPEAAMAEPETTAAEPEIVGAEPEIVESELKAPVITIKEEPMEETAVKVPSETVTLTLEESVKVKTLKSVDSGVQSEIIQSQSSSPCENVPIKSEDDVENDFRPPTPDPRFEVLPPVFRGTELSALCTIM